MIVDTLFGGNDIRWEFHRFRNVAKLRILSTGRFRAFLLYVDEVIEIIFNQYITLNVSVDTNE